LLLDFTFTRKAFRCHTPANPTEACLVFALQYTDNHVVLIALGPSLLRDLPLLADDVHLPNKSGTRPFDQPLLLHQGFALALRADVVGVVPLLPVVSYRHKSGVCPSPPREGLKQVRPHDAASNSLAKRLKCLPVSRSHFYTKPFPHIPTTGALPTSINACLAGS
jgi:hypothetical protein